MIFVYINFCGNAKCNECMVYIYEYCTNGTDRTQRSLTQFTCQIYDLMGHPTGEKQKNDEIDEIISSKADLTFQV